MVNTTNSMTNKKIDQNLHFLKKKKKLATLKKKLVFGEFLIIHLARETKPNKQKKTIKSDYISIDLIESNLPKKSK